MGKVAYLNKEKRTELYKMYLDGMKTSRIAEKFGIKPATARLYINRGNKGILYDMREPNKYTVTNTITSECIAKCKTAHECASAMGIKYSGFFVIKRHAEHGKIKKWKIEEVK